MTVCYNKLWKILIDKNMSKTQLIKAAKISSQVLCHLKNLLYKYLGLHSNLNTVYS